MGFRKPMDYNSVSHQIYIAGVELNSSRNDGFVAFEIKKDLYKLKFLLDQILERSPEFVGEQEFLTEQSKKQMWRQLNEV
jgi:vancomycin permeability regulator SanA